MSETGSQPSDHPFEGTLEAYLREATTCVGALPDLIETYQQGRPVEPIVDQIRSAERACDRHHLSLREEIVSNAHNQQEPGPVRLALYRHQILSISQSIDEIPNLAERVADEFLTMQPPHQQQALIKLQTMATQAETAVSILADLLHDLFRVLCSATASATFAEPIRRIRTIETECDEYRNTAIQQAFTALSPAEALVYRELAHELDAVVDHIEDIIDQVTILGSGESWLTVEHNAIDPTVDEHISKLTDG